MRKPVFRANMDRLLDRFGRLYGSAAPRCLDRLYMLIGRYGIGFTQSSLYRRWSQRDTLLITYGDMVRSDDGSPLASLRRFLNTHAREAIGTVHLLPFYPYSSDDGFSVIDYRKVDPALGTWRDVADMAGDVDLMFDLVLNHVSSRSPWLRDYVQGVAPARDYFIEADPSQDLSSVVRPRNLPLLTPVTTLGGPRHVWSTFSDDQFDLDFRNPDVLFEFLDILLLYVSMGARIIRMDAIAFLWKQIGTSCLHLPETHEVVKLFRDVLDMVAPEVILLTETNVPHPENVSYFGDGDEAHMVYQFSLPPLLLQALLSGDARHLTRWAASLGAPPAGCTFLNFTASHDGIGVRPLQGLIPDEELDRLLDAVRARGGYVSTKRNADGTESPYELNITYFDALGEPGDDAPSERQVARFLCSQILPLALRGVPAVYFNSLVAARNNTGGVEYTGQARTINRGKWDAGELETLIAGDNAHARVFREYVRVLTLRREQPAFHPDGDQRIHDLGPGLFCVERTAPNGPQRLVSITNCTETRCEVDAAGRVPALGTARSWPGLLKGKQRGGDGGRIRLAPYETAWLEAAPPEAGP